MNQMNVNADELRSVLSFIYRSKGIDLSSYRQNFLLRRLGYRMKATGARSTLEYICLIEKNHAEFNRLIDTLSINVTEFFRDPDVFSAFRNVVLDEIIARKISTAHRVIRVWSAGCASGEEPYSIAIAITEELTARRGNFVVRIWGTDVDNGALTEAKKAEYKPSNLKELDKERLNKYFTHLGEGRYKLKEEIRKVVDFKRHNLISDPPLKFMDIIFCRNVMIYLNQKEQEILFRKFNQSLNSNGYLVIGKVENIWSDLKGLFVAVDSRQKIYQKAAD